MNSSAGYHIYSQVMTSHLKLKNTIFILINYYVWKRASRVRVYIIWAKQAERPVEAKDHWESLKWVDQDGERITSL